MNRLFLFLSLLIFNYSLFVFPVSAATYQLTASSPTFNQNCTYSLDIILNAAGELTNAADVIVDYDPSKVEIVDSDPAIAGVQIKNGTVYTNYFGNVVNSTDGNIRLTGATFSGSFSSSGVFATIQFKPLTAPDATTFSVRFTGADPYNTLDSNIADTNTSNDLLASVQNLMITTSTGSCTADSTPPAITFTSPTNGQTGVPSDANMVFELTDDASGVDINTLVVTLNGVNYVSADSQVTVAGNSAHYTVTLNPTDPLFTAQTNSLLVSIADLSGNSRQALATFNTPPLPTYTPAPTPTGTTCTGTATCPVCANTATPTPTATPTSVIDTSSPKIEFVKPKAKDLTELQPSITIKVSDPGSGININTLKIEIADQTILSDNPDVHITGTKSQYTVNFKLPFALNPDSQYALTVFVADNSSNGLSQSIIIKTLSLPNNIFLAIIEKIIPGIIPDPPKPTPPSVCPPTQVCPAQPLQPPAAQFPFGILLLIILSLVAGGASFYYWYSHSKNNSLTFPLGLVYDYLTLEPLSNVKISIKDNSNKVIKKVKTNTYGIFAADLPAGTYRFAVIDTNFRSPPVDYQPPQGLVPYFGDPVIVDPYQKDAFVSIPLTPLKPFKKTTYGQITDKIGRPQGNLTLNLVDTRHGSPIASRITDGDGYYRFIVPSGRYQVTLQPTSQVLYLVDTRHHIHGPTFVNKNITLV